MTDLPAPFNTAAGLSQFVGGMVRGAGLESAKLLDLDISEAEVQDDANFYFLTKGDIKIRIAVEVVYG